MPTTNEHFWRMVHQMAGSRADPVVILMLPTIPRRLKTTPYWPTIESPELIFEPTDDFNAFLILNHVSTTTYPDLPVVHTKISLESPERHKSFNIHHLRVTEFDLDSESLLDIKSLVDLVSSLQSRASTSTPTRRASNDPAPISNSSTIRRKSDLLHTRPRSDNQHQKANSFPINALRRSASSSVPSSVSAISTASKSKTRPPLIVHCHAGTGLTGAYIALDYLFTRAKLRLAETSRFDPVYQVVLSLRQQRIGIIQKLNQFYYIYDMLSAHSHQLFN